MPGAIGARTAVEEVMRTKGRTARATEAAVLLLTPDRADPGDDRRPKSCRQPVQPGGSGDAAAWLRIQALHLSRRNRGRLHPETQIEDSPIETEGWKPTNFGGIYRGKINLRTALTHSSNVAAVRLLEAVGPERAVEVANRLGVRSARNVGPTLALGTSETTLLEMTSSFAVFANGGLAVEPRVVERIRDDQGHILFERAKEERSRIVSARDISAMNDMLNAVVAGGRGTAHPRLLPCRGQNRHDPELQGRLVPWLHRPMGWRRLDGKRQCEPHAQRHGRLASGRDLEGGHAESAGGVVGAAASGHGDECRTGEEGGRSPESTNFPRATPLESTNSPTRERSREAGQRQRAKGHGARAKEAGEEGVRPI